MNKKENRQSIGFCGLLTLLLITFKLLGIISWSWWIVWAPIWLPAAIVIVVLGFLWLVDKLILDMDKWKE